MISERSEKEEQNSCSRQKSQQHCSSTAGAPSAIDVVECVLRPEMSLLSGLAEPLLRFDVVFGNAFAVVVTDAEIVPRFDMSLLSSLASPLHRFAVVLGPADTSPIHQKPSTDWQMFGGAIPENRVKYVRTTQIREQFSVHRMNCWLGESRNG